jgi:hypothetical protein
MSLYYSILIKITLFASLVAFMPAKASEKFGASDPFWSSSITDQGDLGRLAMKGGWVKQSNHYLRHQMQPSSGAATGSQQEMCKSANDLIIYWANYAASCNQIEYGVSARCLVAQQYVDQQVSLSIGMGCQVPSSLF